jgi:FkbM family methyltransferase
MRSLIINTPTPHKMNVPTWFMNNRGDGGIIFENLQKDNQIKEIATYKAMREYMCQFPKDSIFLDVGAQIGLSTLPIASEGYSVIAVEPVSSNIEILKSNIEINKFENVTIAAIAAYSENVDIDIFIPEEEDCASLSSNAAKVTPSTVLKKETAKAMRIEDWLSENEIDSAKIRFIKIDVQGAEEMVIKGMTNLLETNKTISILMEWDPRMMSEMGTSEQNFFNYLTSIGFTGYRWGHADILFTR